MTPRFDPSRTIIVDLAQGQLRDDEGKARLNIPAELVLRLCEQAGPDAARDFARSIGTELGRRLKDTLGDQTDSASIEDWAEHLGGQLAVVGLGDLAVERWGKALVLRVAGTPEGMGPLVSDVLNGALCRALGRDLALVPFEDDSSVAFLVVAPDTAGKVRALLDQGLGLGQSVDRLHRGAA